jgi:hypothetical protein
MIKRTIFSAMLLATPAFAETPIMGTVESKCSIYTDTQGVYGNPAPYKLSTASVDGGVAPIVRVDVASADFYKARIEYPVSFSTAPALNDTVQWTGSVEVNQMSDVAMADYDTNKVSFNNVVEYDLTVAGSTWFKVNSEADYGFTKSFPAGNYTAIVTAECIAK